MISNVEQLRALQTVCAKVYGLHEHMEKINITPTIEEVRAAAWIEFIKDDHGIMLAVSKGYTTLTGITAEDYEGHSDSDIWGADGYGFSLRDSYVRETGFTLETVESWFNPKDQMYQKGVIIKMSYPLISGRIGTRGKIHKDSLEYIDASEYQRLTSHVER